MGCTVKEPLIKSRLTTHPVLREGMRGGEWSIPLATSTTRQPARKTSTRAGCGQIARSRRCTPRHRSPGYDLRRTPGDYRDLAGDAVHGGLNQRFLNFIVMAWAWLLSNAAIAQSAHDTFRDCADCPEMVVIPQGSFEMGSNSGFANEKPVHPVTIARSFAMGKTEVTQGQWRAVMGNNPSYFAKCGDDCPVEQVNWFEAQEFIQKLNAKTGKQYRLPSEAEWEYACRAGGNHQYCGGDNVADVAWYGGTFRNPTHPVASKQANAFNLFDMTGNVCEWVEDSYHDNYDGAPADGSVWQGDGEQHVLRGGSWNYTPVLIRASVRFGDKPKYHFNNNGFRVLRALP